MSLQTAVAGLASAQTGLNTVSNDLANASTTAFKSQTALFADVFPSGESNVPGDGVSTSSISSDFSQGSLVSTGNPLDAAIQGNGFFAVSDNGTQQYTRDGSFQLNSSGQLVTTTGAQVLGYAQNANGTTAGTLSPITINTGSVAGNATTAITLPLNLNSNDKVIAAAFDPTNAATYNSSTSVVAYDSLGNANNVQLYFTQTAAGSWNVYSQTAGQATQAATDEAAGSTPLSAAQGDFSQLTTLAFNGAGALTGGSPAATGAINWGNGANNSNISFNFTGTTLGNQDFAVAGTTNNGYAPGSYSGTTISSNGTLVSTYTNGQKVTAGTLGIANFINQQGLTPISGNLYAQSTTSGQPVIDTPGVGQAGTLSGGSLEQSNASTSSLLVSLIQYQQAYQANASVVQTEQQDGQRLTQI